MLCQFEQIDERTPEGTATFRCKVCGFIAYRVRSKSGDKIVRPGCTERTPRQPTLAEMAESAARAATGFITSGGKIVNTELYSTRMAECRQCPSFQPMFARCGACGCFLHLKAWLPNEKCPLGKWATSSPHPSADPRPA